MVPSHLVIQPALENEISNKLKEITRIKTNLENAAKTLDQMDQRKKEIDDKIVVNRQKIKEMEENKPVDLYDLRDIEMMPQINYPILKVQTDAGFENSEDTIQYTQAKYKGCSYAYVFARSSRVSQSAPAARNTTGVCE